MKKNYVFECEDTTNGIYTAIYKAWEEKNRQGLSHEEISLQLNHDGTRTFFSEYIPVASEDNLAEKVAIKVRTLGYEVNEMIYYATLSHEKDKANTIYHFLALAIRHGKTVVDMLHNPYVMRIMQLRRRVRNEVHNYLGFVRFADLVEGVLYAKIEPKGSVLYLLGDHFSKRLAKENFIIHDATHKLALIHEKQRDWYIASEELLPREVFDEAGISKSDHYALLWKSFFESIAIAERENKHCQDNHLYKRYRENMIEFSQDEKN